MNGKSLFQNWAKKGHQKLVYLHQSYRLNQVHVSGSNFLPRIVNGGSWMDDGSSSLVRFASRPVLHSGF